MSTNQFPATTPLFKGTGDPGEALMTRWYIEDARLYLTPDAEERKGILIVNPKPSGAGVYVVAGGGTSDFERLVSQLIYEVRQHEGTITALRVELDESFLERERLGVERRRAQDEKDRADCVLTNVKGELEGANAKLRRVSAESDVLRDQLVVARTRMAGLEQLVRNLRSAKAKTAARKRKKATS